MGKISIHKSPLGIGKYIGVLKGKYKDGVKTTIKFDYGKTVWIEGNPFYLGRDTHGRIYLTQLGIDRIQEKVKKVI